MGYVEVFNTCKEIDVMRGRKRIEKKSTCGLKTNSSMSSHCSQR